MCKLFILQPSVFSRACSSSSALCLDSRARRNPSYTPSRARSCSYIFSLAPSVSQASSLAFSRKSSSYSSDFSLSSSTRRASSSASIRVCSSSSALCLDSRVRRTPSSNFNRVRLCSSGFFLFSSTRHASSSPLRRACSSSSDFSDARLLFSL